MKGTQRAQSNCRDPEIVSKGRHLKKIKIDGEGPKDRRAQEGQSKVALIKYQNFKRKWSLVTET
jgi:hypothetical protein